MQSHSSLNPGCYYLPLPSGNTRVVIDGDSSGELLVLVHGATVGLWEFDYLVAFLNAAGYKTLRYDLLGHGRSGRPRTAYTQELFCMQFLELLAYLKVEEPFSLLGHSMGAAIAAHASGRVSPLVEHLILVAPLLEHESKLPLKRVLHSGRGGALFLQTFGGSVLAMRRIQRLLGRGMVSLLPAYISQIAMPGHWRAMHGVFKDGALADHSQAYRALGSLTLTKSVFWGSADKVIPSEDIRCLRALIGEHRYQEFQGLGHHLLLSHTEKLASEVINCLS